MLNKYGKLRYAYMYNSRSNLSSVALEPKHRKSKIQIYQKKHSNPNKSKWEAKSDGRDPYKLQHSSWPFRIFSVLEFKQMKLSVKHLLKNFMSDKFNHLKL